MTGCVGHEPNAIDAVAIVEANNLDGAVVEGKATTQRDVFVRVSGGRAGEDDFEESPLLNGCGRWDGNFGGSCNDGLESCGQGGGA